MSWIRILYPKPVFNISPSLGKFKHIHNLALHIAYYIAQTIAHIALCFIYAGIVIPHKIVLKISSRDLLNKMPNKNLDSYFEKAPQVNQIDFKRMY